MALHFSWYIETTNINNTSEEFGLITLPKCYSTLNFHSYIDAMEWNNPIISEIIYLYI